MWVWPFKFCLAVLFTVFSFSAKSELITLHQLKVDKQVIVVIETSNKNQTIGKTICDMAKVQGLCSLQNGG